MYEEEEFRALLNATDVPPTGVDVARVLHVGRRRTRHRRLAGVGGTLAVALTVLGVAPLALGPTGQPGPATSVTASASASVAPSPSPAGPPVCTVTALAMPPEYQTWKTLPNFRRVEVSTADPTGRYIGGHAVVGQNFIPILWTDGKPKVLPIDPTSASIDAINEHGVVVGMSGGSASRAYRYQNGKVTMLRAPVGKTWLFPHPFINAAGDMVINAKPQNAYDDDSRTVVAMWRAGTTNPVILPLPKHAGVRGITDDGRIIGGVGENGSGRDAYVWDQKGNGRKLTGPAGTTTNATAARGDWVTGGAWREGQKGPTVMLWNLRTGEATELTRDLGTGVNASGWVVTGIPRGEVLVDGVALVLPPIVAGGRTRASSVADDGRIAGDSFEGETSVPVQWHCR
ncbi:hypothetical protein AB0B66_34780 [Catellatospora sp. NPDC049111]|uniref:hypothetical protein n=1 Tax=Catellatospora sp. NPDC049111 TaxID=3155271 RepID=UPI0034070414